VERPILGDIYGTKVVAVDAFKNNIYENEGMG